MATIDELMAMTAKPKPRRGLIRAFGEDIAPNIGQALQAAGAGMRGQIYNPPGEEEDTTARMILGEMIKQKMQTSPEALEFEREKAKAQMPTPEELQGLFGAPPQPQGIAAPSPAARVKSYTKGGVTYERLPSEEEEKATLRRQAKAGTVPPAQIGLYTLAGESIGNIVKVKKILFPQGVQSFRRDVALKSKIPFFGAAPIDKEAQRIFRMMGSSLSGRQLIQTGVAARPEETKSLSQQFMASALSDPEAAYEGLTQLEDFYKSYRRTLKTRGLEGSEGNEFDSVEEAEAVGLPSGTPVYINGREAVIE